MARSDIKAGAAYVELYVRNSKFLRGLNNAKQRLNDFGNGMLSIGTKIAGLGTGIVGSLGAAAGVFAATGDHIQKMSARTGVAADKLSALQFAAQQSGATIDDVGGAIQKMNRRLGRLSVGEGTQSQVDAMQELGLSIDEIRQMNPEQRFMALADAMANYGDDAAAAGLAQRAFGTGVDKLLPLFANGSAGIRELMDEASELGVVMSTEDANAAAALTDAIGRVQSTLTALTQQIGAAVAPVVEELANRFAKGVAEVIKFVKENRALIVLAGKVGVILAGIGTAIAAVGVVFIGAGAAISGFITVVATVGTIISGLAAAIGLVLSPVGLIVGALIAAGVAFFRFSETGRNAMQSMSDRVGSILSSLRDTFGKAFEGIRDALAGGDLQLAGQIAMTALRVVVTQGIEALSKMIGGTMGDVVGTFLSQITGGDFAGAWNTVVLGMTSVWEAFSAGIVSTFVDAAKTVVDTWKGAVDQTTNYILQQAGQGGVFGKVFEMVSGVNVQEELAREQRLRSQAAAMGLNSDESDIAGGIRTGTYQDPGVRAAADAATAFLGTMQSDAQAQAAASGGALSDATGDAASGASAEVARLQEELAGLQRRAKEQREEAKAKVAEEGEGGEGASGAAGTGGKASAAMFSAAAIFAQSQGTQSPAVRKQEEIKQEIAKGNEQNGKLLDRIVVGLDNLSLTHG